MVRVTGKSLETLYRYIAGKLDGKAPAGHEHTQAQVAGLPDALNGKAAAKHEHAQEDVAGLTAALDGKVVKSIGLEPGTDLNTVTQSGFYRINIGHGNQPDGTDYGQLIVSRGADTIAQIVIGFSNSKVFCRSGNPVDVGGPGSWNEWKRLYQEGDKVLSKVKEVVIDVPTTGWNYTPTNDAYMQDFSAPGVQDGNLLYLRTANKHAGANFPLIAAFPMENSVRLVMMAPPTFSTPITIHVLKVE